MSRFVVIAVAVVLVVMGVAVFVNSKRSGMQPTDPALRAATKTLTVPVEGMSCASCAASVRKTLKSIDGVAAVEVDLEHRRARVEYAAEKVTPQQVQAAVTELGYKAGEPSVEAAR